MPQRVEDDFERDSDQDIIERLYKTQELLFDLDLLPQSEVGSTLL